MRDRPKLVEFAPWQLDSSAGDQERLFPSFPLQKRRNLGALPRKVSSWDRSIWDDPEGLKKKPSLVNLGVAPHNPDDRDGL